MPLQVPVVAFSVWPSCGVPVTTGRDDEEGGCWPGAVLLSAEPTPVVAARSSATRGKRWRCGRRIA
jgi:hypothetical protein